MDVLMTVCCHAILPLPVLLLLASLHHSASPATMRQSCYYAALTSCDGGELAAGCADEDAAIVYCGRVSTAVGCVSLVVLSAVVCYPVRSGASSARCFQSERQHSSTGKQLGNRPMQCRSSSIQCILLPCYHSYSLNTSAARAARSSMICYPVVVIVTCLEGGSTRRGGGEFMGDGKGAWRASRKHALITLRYWVRSSCLLKTPLSS